MPNQIHALIGQMAQTGPGNVLKTAQIGGMATAQFSQGASLAMKMSALLSSEEQRLQNNMMRSQEMMQRSLDSQFKQDMAIQKFNQDATQYNNHAAVMEYNMRAKERDFNEISEYQRQSLEMQKARADAKSGSLTANPYGITANQYAGVVDDALKQVPDTNAAGVPLTLGEKLELIKPILATMLPGMTKQAAEPVTQAPSVLPTQNQILAANGGPTIAAAAQEAQQIKAAEFDAEHPYHKVLKDDLDIILPDLSSGNAKVSEGVYNIFKQDPVIAGTEAGMRALTAGLSSKNSDTRDKFRSVYEQWPASQRKEIDAELYRSGMNNMLFDPIPSTKGEKLFKIKNFPTGTQAGIELQNQLDVLNTVYDNTGKGMVQMLNNSDLMQRTFRELGSWIGLNDSAGISGKKLANRMARNDNEWIKSEHKTAPNAMSSIVLAATAERYIDSNKNWFFGNQFTGTNIRDYMQPWKQPVTKTETNGKDLPKQVDTTLSDYMFPSGVKIHVAKSKGYQKKSDAQIFKEYKTALKNATANYSKQERRFIAANIGQISKALDTYIKDRRYPKGEGIIGVDLKDTDTITVKLINMRRSGKVKVSQLKMDVVTGTPTQFAVMIQALMQDTLRNAF